MSDYTFRFGTYPGTIMKNGTSNHVYKGYTPLHMQPWELPHVDSLSVSIGGQTTTMGLPNKPASKSLIFDYGGPIRKFKISGRRYDNEPAGVDYNGNPYYISNMDFLHNQFNLVRRIGGGYDCYVGLSWLLSCMQVTLCGYVLQIEAPIGDDRFINTNLMGNLRTTNSGTYPVSVDDARFNITNPQLGDYTYIKANDGFGNGTYFYNHNVEEKWVKSYSTPGGINVALTGMSAEITNEEEGIMSYSLDLSERRATGSAYYKPFTEVE